MLGLWDFDTTFNTISAISSVLLVEEVEYLEKTTDLPVVVNQLQHVPEYIRY